MDAVIKEEAIVEWGVFPDLKFECKREPVADLVPVLPGYLKTEPQVKTEAGSPGTAEAHNATRLETDPAHRAGSVLRNLLFGDSAVSGRKSPLPPTPAAVNGSSLLSPHVQRKAGGLDCPNAASATLPVPALPTKTEAVEEIILIDSDDEDATHDNSLQTQGVGVSTAKPRGGGDIPAASASVKFPGAVRDFGDPCDAFENNSMDTYSTDGRTSCPATAEKSVREVVLIESEDEDTPRAVGDNSGKGNSLHTRGVGVTTAEPRGAADIPGTSRHSGAEGGDSSTDASMEDSRDTLQGGTMRVSREKSREKEISPVNDVTPAPEQNTGTEPHCLGPFYRPTRCPVCSEEIPDGDSAKRHRCFRKSLAAFRFSETGRRSKLKCSLCDKPEYHCPSAYTRHVTRHFVNLYFSCSICGKKFREKYHFTLHSYTHTGQWQYRCRVCGLGCTSQSSLDSHEEIHSEENLAICDICGVSFKTSRSLTHHLEQHEGKFYTCTVCNKVYKTSKIFKRHLRCHDTVEEQKQYKCDLCDKVYKTSPGLKLHRDKYHFPEKKYSCNICNKVLVSKTTFKMHMMFHSGEKRYTCDICKKKFFTKTTLARHIAEHSGDKNFSCDICGMKFTQRGSVKRHKGTAHS